MFEYITYNNIKFANYKNPYNYRCLKLNKGSLKIFYRYPYEYDGDKDFLKKLVDFICNDIKTIKDTEYNRTYFTSYKDDKVSLIDKITFEDHEKKYLARLHDNGNSDS